jgi:hypothetical protein
LHVWYVARSLGKFIIVEILAGVEDVIATAIFSERKKGSSTAISMALGRTPITLNIITVF